MRIVLIQPRVIDVLIKTNITHMHTHIILHNVHYTIIDTLIILTKLFVPLT